MNIISSSLIYPVIPLHYLLGVLFSLITIFEGSFPLCIPVVLHTYWWTPLLENFNAAPGALSCGSGLVMRAEADKLEKLWHLWNTARLFPLLQCGNRISCCWHFPLLSGAGGSSSLPFPWRGVKYLLSLQTTCHSAPPWERLFSIKDFCQWTETLGSAGRQDSHRPGPPVQNPVETSDPEEFRRLSLRDLD